jgi:orotidine-5'-phosphate decarboxylase
VSQARPTGSLRASFYPRLWQRWHAARTMLCIGLDPEVEQLPQSLLDQLPRPSSRSESHDSIAELLFRFALVIAEATHDLACAFKPNAAFYERYGAAGWRALESIIHTLAFRYPEVPVILDAKRGDIGSTSQAYADAVFGSLRADAVTLQPYLGRDALQPFLDRPECGCFILCRTSNPDSGEFQNLPTPREDGGSEPLFLAVARRVASVWNAEHNNCGLVVGATYPEELQMVRAVAGDVPILVPGIGAQGGDLAEVVRNGLDSQRGGLVISASRSILYASNGPDFAEAARFEAQRLRDEIERLRQAA